MARRRNAWHAARLTVTRDLRPRHLAWTSWSFRTQVFVRSLALFAGSVFFMRNFGDLMAI